MDFLVDLTEGGFIPFIHSFVQWTSIGTYFLPDTVLVPRNKAEKGKDKIPTLRACVTCQRRNLYCYVKRKEKVLE